MSPWKTSMAGFVLALMVSMSLHQGALQQLLFHVGIFPAKREIGNIETTLKTFNADFASFFDSGGDLQKLNEFPAANLVKRRVFQDINSLKASNTLLVYDRDISSRTTSIKFLNADRAVAETVEMWFLSLQDATTRRPLSSVKANKIKVRYLLNTTAGRWQVVDFAVFGNADDMSLLPVKEF